MERLATEVQTIGKANWRPMLHYVASLHAKSIYPPRYPFPYPWEEIGPGYCYGPAFGHWDIVHAVLDVLPAAPEHARQQLLNNLAAQQDDGLVPGVIWMAGETARWSHEVGHPPLWPFAVQDYADRLGSDELIVQCYPALVKQIRWFENHRTASGTGFYYLDILAGRWESGVDEGIRFLGVQPGPLACVDATAHVYALYTFAAAWSKQLGKSPDEFESKAARLRDYLQNELFVEETGFFHDSWSVRDPGKRVLAFEGMWPLVVGAATPEQARRVIDENLLNPERFFAHHPISTVGLADPHFELRMWRGPAWNSMTYWAARGCLRYGRVDAARLLLQHALDASAAQFARTGTIWEFYHPYGGDPQQVQRKPHTQQNTPCTDYLGHNPLIAMARMYDAGKR